jgi:hypothetical protein
MEKVQYKAMKENGLEANSMEMEFANGEMDLFMMAIILMDKNKVRENLCLLQKIITSGIGWTDTNTAWVVYMIRTDKLDRKGYG